MLGTTSSKLGRTNTGTVLGLLAENTGNKQIPKIKEKLVNNSVVKGDMISDQYQYCITDVKSRGRYKNGKR